MAICTRGARLLPMVLMARQATDAFMDADSSAVVGRAGLPRGQGCVALVA